MLLCRWLLKPSSRSHLLSRRGKSTVQDAAAQTTIDHPPLVRVPKLPVVGSLVQSHSGIPLPFHANQDNIFDFWPAMRQAYGSFYEMGYPGLGQGLTGSCYVVQDPQEMAAILRREGEYPRGTAEFSWPFGKYFQERGLRVGAMVRHGPEWKRMRRFIQADLLSPAAGARYVPAILEAAQAASRGAPHFEGNLNEYLNLASFDLFSNVMMGYIPQVSDPTSHSDPEDEEFCRNVAASLRLASQMFVAPDQVILNNTGLGYKTPKYKQFEQLYDKAFVYSRAKVRELYQNRLNDTLTDKEKDSYANIAYDRQATEHQPSTDNDAIQLEEVDDVVGMLVGAGVDTTGGMLSFKLLHLASSPEVQDKLYHELQPTLVNGKLSRESLVVPYLTQVLRESHRLATPTPGVPVKTLLEDRQVHGHSLAKGSVVVFDSYSTGHQQDHFEDSVREFVPERFSKQSVEARKGTRHQVVDHAFFNGPFSQGARKCPGSRVANLEAQALVAQWVLDWKMELPADVAHFQDVPYGQKAVVTSSLPAIQFTPRSP